LIRDGELQKEAFKDIIPQMEWYFVDVRLSQNKSGRSYSGKLETDSKIVLVRIRPTLLMTLSESFKNCDVAGNLVAPGTDRTVDFGTSVEVKLTPDFLKKMLKLAKPKKKTNATRILEW
jgi:hypothetical protein